MIYSWQKRRSKVLSKGVWLLWGAIASISITSCLVVFSVRVQGMMMSLLIWLRRRRKGCGLLFPSVKVPILLLLKGRLLQIIHKRHLEELQERSQWTKLRTPTVRVASVYHQCSKQTVEVNLFWQTNLTPRSYCSYNQSLYQCHQHEK